MVTFFAIILFVHVLIVVGAHWTYAALTKCYPIDEPYLAPEQEAPRVTICIPARNEEDNIEQCVRSACSQTYAATEVVVLNDNSEDRTGEILAQLQEEFDNLKVLQGKELAPGWLGKPHALWQVQAKATGEYLLFIDADGKLHPRCLSAVMKVVLKEDIPFLTLVPRILLTSFWEWTVQAAMVKSIVGLLPVHIAADPSSKSAVAFGPFMLFKRSAYDAIGGHEAVKDDVIEDKGLAALLKQHGFPIKYVLGTRLQTIHMYKGFWEIWRGWSKNFFPGLERNVFFAIGVTIAFLAIWVAPYLLIPAGLVMTLMHGGSLSLWLFLSVVFLGLRYLHHLTLNALYDLDVDYWYLEPIGFLVLCGIVWNSTYITLAKRPLAWRGRNIHQTG